MDDTLDGSWQLDPETRRKLRFDTIRAAMARRDFAAAALEAEELLDEDPDNPEALWMLGESLLELRDYVTARDVYKSHVETAGARPATLVAWALAAFESCEIEECADAARQAIEHCEDLADAHYLLGLCIERLESPAAAEPHFAHAHRMSPMNFPYPLSLTEADWHALIDAGIGQLDDHLQAFWQDVPVRLEAFPDLSELQRSMPPLSPRIAALYEGEPRVGDPEKPAALRVFTSNLVRSDSHETLIHQLILSLEQEAMDWLDAEKVP